MTTLLEAIREVLEDDSTLSALATGGIWDHDKIASEGYGRDGLTLSVVTNGTPVVQPCIYVTVSAEGPIYPVKARAKRVGIEIYFYDQQTYATIHTMKERVYALLHEQRVDFDEPSDWYCRQLVFTGELRTLRDPNLSEACMERSQYYARIIKLLED